MQCTEIGNTQSKLDFIKSGVPQGSILGPLLFLLYINDIVLSSDVFKFILFADDTSLFYSHKNKTEAIKIINLELSKISQWLAANKLSLNVGKSKLLIFTNQKIKSAKKPPDPRVTHVLTNNHDEDDENNIRLNGEILEEVDHAKYLGVLIDNKLNWKFHIDSITLKLSKGTGLLAKIRHFVPSVVLRSLYFSFTNPYIDYNLLNWGMAPTTNLNLVDKKIKKTIRIISFKDRDAPCTPLYKELKILPLNKSIELRQAKYMWKLYNGFLPQSLRSNFTPNQRTQFSTSTSRLGSLNQYILFAGPKIWNEIPHAIKKTTSLNSFSINLNKHYLHHL